MAAEPFQRSSLADDPTRLAQAGWNPLLQDLPGNFLLVPDLASDAANAGQHSAGGLSAVEVTQVPGRKLVRRESFESIRAKSLQRDDSSSASQHESPDASTSVSPQVRIDVRVGSPDLPLCHQ